MVIKKYAKSCLFYDKDVCVFKNKCTNTEHFHRKCRLFDSGVFNLTNAEVNSILKIMKEADNDL